MGNCWSYQSNPLYYPTDFLAAVNYFRSHHILTPPLVLDSDLCKKALAEANLAAYHDNEDIDFRKRRHLKEGLNGELIWIQKKVGKEFTFETNPFAAPEFWYEEIVNFEFGKPEKQKEGKDKFDKDIALASNFQTLIWRTTKKVGVGVAFNKAEDKIYVVGKFDGEYSGSTDPNVILSNVKPGINGLPALKIDISNVAQLEKGVAKYKISLLPYMKWNISTLTQDRQNYNIGTYLCTNKRWVKKPFWAEETSCKS